MVRELREEMMAVIQLKLFLPYFVDQVKLPLSE